MVLNKNEPKTGKRLKGTNAAKEDTPAAISGSQKLKIFSIFKILKGVCQSHILPAIKAKAATPPLPFCYNQIVGSLCELPQCKKSAIRAGS